MPLDPRILEYVERQRAERGIDWFREQIAAEEQPPEEPTILGELGKGALSGTDNLQAGLFGGAGILAQAVGAEGVRDWALEGAERNMAEAQENAPAVGSYKDVGGIRDAALYVAGGLGQLAPSLALSVGTGGAGGLLVRGAALKAGQLASQQAAKEGLDEVQQAALEKQIANRILARGATVGAAGSEGATIAGQVYGDRAAEGEYGIAVPLATGVAAGALGGIADSRVIGALLGTSKAGVGRTAATVAGLESATEVGQTALENLAKGDPLTQGMVDAGILGGLGGGIVGGAARAIGGAPAEDAFDARDPLGDALARAAAQRNTRADERGLTAVAPDAQFQQPDGSQIVLSEQDATDAALARARAISDGTEGPISSSTPTREALPSPEMVFGTPGAMPMPDRSGTIDLSSQLANPVEQAKARNQGALSTAEALRRASLVEDKQGPISSPPPQAPAAGAITGQPGTVQPDLTAARQTPAQSAASAAADEKAQATYATRQAEEQRRAQAMQAAAPQTMRLRDGSLLVDGNVESVITKFGGRYDDTLQATVVPPKQAKKAEAFLAPAPAQGMQGGGASVTSVIPSSKTPTKLPSIPEARAKRETWQSFDPAETMGVPRAEMPQIKAGDRSSLVQFARARGVQNTQETVDPASLKPTQMEYSPAKVAQARAFVGNDRAILVSSDNRIIDGHHQWMAKREAGVPIRVIRMNKPASELLPIVREFPSATFEAGSTRNIAAAPAVAESTEPALSRKESVDGVQAAPQTAEASGAVPDAVAARPGRTPKVSRRERIASVLAEAAEARGDEAPKRTRVVEPPLKLSGMKLILGQTFGREVVFFDTDDDNAPNGFADPEDPKALYINTRAEKPVQRIVMHELLHSLRTTNEKSYRALKRQVKDMVESDAMTKWRDTYLRKLTRKEGGGYEGDIRDDLVIEEILADAMGDYGTTQEFWQKLSERMEPSLFQRVVQTFAKILQKMMDALGKRSDLGSKRYFSDLQGVQRALLEFADANRLDNTEDTDAERDDVMQARKAAPLPVGKAVNEAIDSAADLDAAFRFASSKTFGTNRAFKVELQARLRALARGMNRDLSEETDANDQYLVRMVERDAKIALRDNANAVGWYDEKVSKARAVLALIHPEIETDPNARFAFTWALAATSNGLKVDKNFELAERAYRRYVADGKMPTDIGIGTASKAINDAMRVFNSMASKMPLEKFAELMTTKAPVREIEKLTGYEVSGESPDAEVYGAAIIGPKIGNGFFANLYGHFEQLTMDRWLMRTWGRWTGTLIERNQEQINAKRELLPALIRKLSAEERAELGRVIGKRIGEKASNADEIAAAITKASQKEVNRNRMRAIGLGMDLADVLPPPKKGQPRHGLGDEIRKAGNALTKYVDGQKEAPDGAVERRRIRRVFNRSLANLQKQYPGLTMSDLQALLWYPEKRLYDAAGAVADDDSAEAGYADDEAPDYANSAVKLAGLAGVEKSKIDAAIKEVDRARNELERGPGAAQRRGGDSRVPAPARPAEDVRLSRQAVGGGAGGRPSPDGQVPASERAVPQAERGAQGQAGQLKPLPGYAHRKVEGAGPIPEIVAAAEQYARKAGIPIKRQARYAEVDAARAKRIADAYTAMEHTPNDPLVREAYRDLITQTTAQYQALVDAGYQFWFIDTKQESNQEYASSPWNAIRELRSSKRMGVFPTNDGFGTGEFNPAANPLLEETAFEWPIGGPDGPLQPVLANDLFRAVHDAFGHGLEGAGFRAQGEENAWQAHVRLFHGPAVAAITTETRGQNSWLNYGPHGERNRTAKTEDTIFADQKTGLLPAWAWMEGREFDSLNEITDAKQFAAAVKRVKEGRPFAFPLHLHDEQTYADARLFLSDDGESGFALIGDEIASLFSAGNGAVTSVLAQAVQEGGRRVEAYRTRMPKALATGGFMPVARVAFDREQADPAWDAAKFRQFQNGEPDLVMFAYMPGESVDVADVPLVSYDEAVELQKQAVAKRPVMLSRKTRSGEDTEFGDPVVAEYMRLTDDDTAFQYAVSQEKEFARLADDVLGKGYTVEEEQVDPAYRKRAELPDGRVLPGVKRQWRISRDVKIATAKGPMDVVNEAVVYQAENGTLWLDISNNEAGTGGAAIYAAVANYAYNNDMVFVEDPAGLSSKAIARRVEHMLSQAMKFGTIRHMRPGDRLLAPVEVGPDNNRQRLQLEWSANDERNIRKLIEFTSERVIAEVPEIENLGYDLVNGTLLDTDGSPLPDGELDWIARPRADGKISNAGRAQAGRATLERALLGRALLRELDGRAVGDVDNVPGSRAAAKLRRGLLYSRKQVESPAFKRWFGDSVAVVTVDPETGDPVTSSRQRGVTVPEVMYHSTDADFDQFEVGRETVNGGTFGNWTTRRAAIFVTPENDAAEAYSKADGKFKSGANVMPVYVKAERPLDLSGGLIQNKDANQIEAAGGNPRAFYRFDWSMFDEESGGFDTVEMLKSAGYDSVIFWDENPDTGASFKAYALFAPEQLKSATGNNGDFNPADRRITFSRRSQPLYAGQPDMELGKENLREKMTRLLVNNMNRVEKAKEYLAARGAMFNDTNDVETAETLYYGKSGEMLRQLDQRRIKPLMELVKTAENMGLDVAKVDEYLIAKHAEERNRAVAAINKNFPDAGSGMKTDDARRILASYSGPRLAKLEAISNAVQDMHRERVKMLRDFGLTDPDELDAWARKYKHYVPLKTVDEEPDGMGTGMGYDIRGKESKRALGRGDRATSPLLVSILDAQRTIIRAQKAEVGRTILRFAEQDTNEDLFEIRDQDAFRTTVFNSATGKTQDALDTAAMRDAFAVKQGGKLKFIVVKDEVLKDQLQKIGASQVGPVLGLIGKGTRALSKLYTQYNPSFTLVNAVRDAITAGVNAKAYDRISSGRLIRELPKAWKAIAAVNFGKGNAQWKQTYEEFLEDGASSAGFGLDTIKDLRTKAEREFRLAVGQNGLSRSKQAWHATVRGMDRVGTLVSNANEIFENAARLSLYAQAREKGYTRQQAARMAKEVTVNFNRKGEWGSQINSAFMFFNAAVQGNRALYTHMQKSPKVKAAVMGIGAIGFALAMLNDGLDEDEETGDEVENKISDWELDHSAVLFTDSDGTRVKFPLPYGYNVAYVLGRRAYRFLTGKDSAQKTAIGMVAAAYDSFMPLGGSADDSTIAQAGVRMMLPTIGTPFFDLAVNRDSFGKPIAKEIVSRYDANVPDSQRYFGGVSPWAKGLTEWLNSATGGNAAKAGAIDINPEHLDFWLKFVTGGVGSTVTGLGQLAGDEPSLDRTPIVKAFYGNEPDYYISSRFREVREVADVLEGRMRDRDETLTPEELRVARASKVVGLSLNRLYKRLKALQAAGQDTAAIEERIEQQQRRLIKAFNSTELGEAA